MLLDAALVAVVDADIDNEVQMFLAAVGDSDDDEIMIVQAMGDDKQYDIIGDCAVPDDVLDATKPGCCKHAAYLLACLVIQNCFCWSFRVSRSRELMLPCTKQLRTLSNALTTSLPLRQRRHRRQQELRR